MKPRVLITGGQGDMAVFIADQIRSAFDVCQKSRAELDVRSQSEVQSLFSEGDYDFIVHTAGTLNAGRVTEISPDDWIRDIEVNAIGTFNLLHHALKRNPKTKIVLISSTAAFNSYNDWTSYCIGKYAQVSLARALIKDGYKIYCFCPGAIDTKFRAGLKIVNSNVMSLEEACEPIVASLTNGILAPGVYLYRKGHSLKHMESQPV